jgi:predicted nucleic acid-binding protein
VNYKRIFVDANVLIDLFDASRPLRKFSIEAIQKILETEAELHTSCDLITTVYYRILSQYKIYIFPPKAACFFN